MKRPQHANQSAVDLHTPLTDYDRSVMDKVHGIVEPRQERPVYHGDNCPCEACCDTRASVDIYLRQRELFSQNGFI